MSVFAHRRALAALAPLAAVAASLTVAPAAQAATSTSINVAKPTTVWLTCTSVTEGESNNQWYIEIACTPVQATSWGLAIECSNNVWYYSGSYTT